MRRLFLSVMISVFALCAAAQEHHEWEGLLYQVAEMEDIEADAWDAMRSEEHTSELQSPY